jgi:two-component system, NarL family, response regulator DevR
VSGEIKVAVVEDHEILRRGLVAVLAEDRRLRVMTLAPNGSELAPNGPPLATHGPPRAPNGPPQEEIDIAVVSSEIARRTSFSCPVIVYSEDPERSNGLAAGNEIAGVLDSGRLTAVQLRATVHAAAAGLRVNAYVDEAPPVLEPRARRVLELLADGYSTREIAELMSYSERTIKKLITTLQDRFDARTRAHVVAQAVRRGLI